MTDAQIDALWADACQRDQPTRDLVRAFARAAIAAARPQQPAPLTQDQIVELASSFNCSRLPGGQRWLFVNVLELEQFARAVLAAAPAAPGGDAGPNFGGNRT
jgi:hypothetical protein